MKKYLLVVFISIFYSCQNHITDDKTNVLIEMSANDVEETIPFETIIDSTWSVQLETNEDCLISFCDRMLIGGNHIIIFDRSQQSVFIFSKEGQFINKIDSRGRGPNEYTSISDIIINPENEIVLFDIGSNKEFYYTVFGELLRVEDSEEKIYFYDVLEFGDNNYAYYTGMKGNPDELIRKHQLYVRTNEQERYFYFPIMGEAEAKVVTPDKYLLDAGNEVLFQFPFGNEIYRINKDTVEQIYTIDFGNNSLPEEAKYITNVEQFLQEYANNEKYYCLTGSIMASAEYLIIPVFVSQKLFANIFYSRNTNELYFTKSFLNVDGEKRKVFVRWIEDDTVAEIEDGYSIYVTDSTYDSDDENNNPVVSFYKLKSF